MLLFSSLWVTPMMGMELDCIRIVPLLPSHCCCFFVFGHGVPFFGRFQHPPVDGCSTASCDFGALTGRDEQMRKRILLHHLELDVHDLSFLMLSLKPAFSLSSFTLIKRLFSSSSFSAITMVLSFCLMLLIFSQQSWLYFVIHLARHFT